MVNSEKEVLYSGQPLFCVAPVAESSSQAELPEFRRACKWFEQQSNGLWRPRVTFLDPVSLPRPVGYYRVAGGKGVPPCNSQTMAADLIAALETKARERLKRASGRLVIVAPGSFKPHVWHIRNGGIALGRTVLVNRYAVLPFQARLGAIVHELAHLLLGWRDIHFERPLDAYCLMAGGSKRGDGTDPSPPCAPLLVKAGWRTTVPLERECKIKEFDPLCVGVVRHGEMEILVEKRIDVDPECLLVYRPAVNAGLFLPNLKARIPVKSADKNKSVLGLIATALRRITADLV